MLNWQQIDTVLLDMDGTLLDLCFDNQFWLEHLPSALAAKEGVSLEQGKAKLMPLLKSQRGSLNWYCTNYWTQVLGLDVVELKAKHRQQIRWRQGSQPFLQWLSTHAHLRVLLVTNAHPDTLVIKEQQTLLQQYMHEVVTSHQYQAPKEDQHFWQQLQAQHPFDPERTLLIDDSLDVLKAAKTFGIRHLLSISQPDSSCPPRDLPDWPHINNLSELIAE